MGGAVCAEAIDNATVAIKVTLSKSVRMRARMAVPTLYRRRRDEHFIGFSVVIRH
jgi:hypothetical protein